MKLPSRPRSSLRFPRKPSSGEKVVLQRVFDEKLMNVGLKPHEYYRDLNKYVLEWTFDSWSEVIKGFNKLISFIRSGRIYDLRDGKIKPPSKVFVPWKTVADAIVHFTSVVIRNARYLRKEPRLEELREQLDQYGIHVTHDEIKEAVMEAWERKDVWFTNISLEELNRFLAS